MLNDTVVPERPAAGHHAPATAQYVGTSHQRAGHGAGGRVPQGIPGGRCYHGNH